MAAPGPQGDELGFPVTIAQFDENSGKILLDQKACDGVFLAPEVRNMPTAICTVNGPIRLGKSLINNFLILQNNVKEDAEAPQLISPAAYFKSESGTEKVTKGFVIWSKPITITNANNTKVAVFLLDTEGLFEDGNPEKRDILIFAFCAKLASIQFYFFDDRLKPSELDSLQYLINFANNVVKQEDKQFQKIVYLVRNWDSEKKHKFGKDGGTNYLQEFMQKHPSSWDSINQCYSSVNCFLLPHPGEAVVGRTFVGLTTAISKPFVESVKDLLLYIKNPENVSPKVINGKIANSRAISINLKEIVVELNKAELPDKIRLVEVLAIRDSNALLKKYAKVYYTELIKNLDRLLASNTISEPNIERAHEIIRSKCMKEYKNEAKRAKLPVNNNNAEMEFQMEMESIRINQKNIYLEMQKNKKLQEQNTEGLNQYSNNIAAKEAEITELKRQTETQYTAHQHEIVQIKELLQQAIEKEKSLNSQLEVGSNTIAGLNQQIQTKNSSIENKNDTIEHLKAEINKLKKEYQDVSSSFNFQKERVSDLETEVSEYSKKQSRIDKQYRELQGKFDKTNADLSQLQAKYHVKSKEHEEAVIAQRFAEAQVQNYTLQISQTEKEIQSLERRVKVAEERATQAELEAENVKREIKDIQRKAQEEVSEANLRAQKAEQKGAEGIENAEHRAKNVIISLDSEKQKASEGLTRAQEMVQNAERRATDAEQREKDAEERAQLAEERAAVAEQKEKDADEKAQQAEQRALDAEGKAKKFEEKAKEVEEKANEIQELYTVTIQRVEDNRENSISVNNEKFSSMIKEQMLVHNMLKRKTEENINSLITDRREVVRVTKIQVDDIKKMKEEDKDMKTYILFMTIIAIICSIFGLHVLSYSLLAWTGTIIMMSFVFIIDCILYQSKAIESERRARENLYFKLEDDGTKLLNIQTDLKSLMSSSERLEKSRDLMNDNPISDDIDDAIKTGPLRVENLNNILELSKQSRVLPTNQEPPSYNIKLEANDLVKGSLEEIRSLIKKEVLKFESACKTV